MPEIKVLAFDTGGTILDWHGGITAVLAECSARRRVERDWHALADEYRRRALGRMLGAVEPDFNIDDVHRDTLDGLLNDSGITAFSSEDRRAIAARWHELDPPDLPGARPPAHHQRSTGPVARPPEPMPWALR